MYTWPFFRNQKFNQRISRALLSTDFSHKNLSQLRYDTKFHSVNRTFQCEWAYHKSYCYLEILWECVCDWSNWSMTLYFHKNLTLFVSFSYNCKSLNRKFIWFFYTVYLPLLLNTGVHEAFPLRWMTWRLYIYWYIVSWIQSSSSEAFAGFLYKFLTTTIFSSSRSFSWTGG